MHEVVIVLDKLQLRRPRERVQRIVRRMLRVMESFVDSPQLQWITEVRIMLRRERPDETKSTRNEYGSL